MPARESVGPSSGFRFRRAARAGNRPVMARRNGGDGRSADRTGCYAVAPRWSGAGDRTSGLPGRPLFGTEGQAALAATSLPGRAGTRSCAEPRCGQVMPEGAPSVRCAWGFGPCPQRSDGAGAATSPRMCPGPGVPEPSGASAIRVLPGGGSRVAGRLSGRPGAQPLTRQGAGAGSRLGDCAGFARSDAPARRSDAPRRFPVPEPQGSGGVRSALVRGRAATDFRVRCT